MLLQAILAVCQYVLALGLGLHLPLSMFLLIVPISGVLASLPVTLNGLGLRETAYLFLFGMAGVGRDDAIALGLLYFSATMLGGSGWSDRFRHYRGSDTPLDRCRAYDLTFYSR